ncbi:SusD/RagB family nutrient-binding outer membrane lipoprotein [Chondrinema litorale]|uniref:SusD/RagB family nutrient-binding outer membrane lipoprotein n=1 Tax=Chondrinema litorale TaxID=2994555 RepID=UPI0025431947|nr:SusD/RagB family nutrient-binding outer membrane lipoprotein [Chondrinema litorale]UZR93117.1 SusD/RagB family nutrient-binding outer membrane lipoprotein [Chondrinema litorale]
MKHLNKLYTYITVFALVVFSACTDGFEEMNENPNEPTEVSPQYILTFALESTINNYWGNKTRNQRLNFDHAMSWVGYLTRNIYESEGDNYNVQPSVNISNWEVFYTDGLINFEKIVEFSDENSDDPNTNYEGIGIGMKAWTYSLMTDVWGAIPYSQGLSGTAEEPIYSPAYDTQEAIYASIIADLDLANSKLNVNGPSVSGDILFNGDILLWKKFINSTRFKLLNRQAHIVSSSGAEMQAMLDDPTTYPMIESTDDIAQLNYGGLASNNPWNDILIQQSRTDWNISEALVDAMLELDDPRLEVYATPGGLSEGVYSGHPNGLPGEIATLYLGYSATINQDNFAQTNSPAVLMTYAELLFIKAEAALDGDISGDPQEFYEAGIEASFDQYGLTVPADYASGTADKESIMTQKWLALFGQGIEAWTELRRTGYPELPDHDPRAIFMNDGVLPTRIVYPSTEYSLNASNVAAGASLIGGDNMKAELWWVE